MTKVCLIMAGGTGGHVFPGLAVADALSAEGWQVEWLGTAERMEAQVVPKHGYPIHFISVKGLRGKGIKAKVGGFFALLKGLWEAFWLVKKLKPSLVLGMGGYASGPGGFAAWLQGIPVVVHEQNAAAGMTNKLLGRLAKRVLLGFEQAQSSFNVKPGVCIAVGNPVRAEIKNIPPKEIVDAPLNMLVLGGSLGSRPLNQTVPMVVSQLPAVNVIHQCGKGNAQDVVEAYGNAKGIVEVREFIEDMARMYAWADFVVCRAGALTVAEVAAAGLPAIFVPLPHAVDDHQTKNAQTLVDAQAAWLIPQQELETQLSAQLSEWIANPNKCLTMGHKAKSQALLCATEEVVKQCNALLGEAA